MIPLHNVPLLKCSTPCHPPLESRWIKTSQCEWLNMAQYGSIWLNMAQYGSIWLNMAQYGSIWLNMAQYGSIWLNMAQYGSIWLNMAQYGSIWLNMAQYGSIWLNMAQYGSIWLNMAQWFTLAYFIFQVWRVTRDQTRPASTADPGHPGPRYASDLNTVYGIPVYHIRISRYPNTIKYPDIQYPADQWFAVFLSVLNCLPHCCGSMN